MSFTPSLSGAIYTDSDLTEARRVWSDIDKHYLPGWLANPTGHLAPLFKSDSPHAVFILIDIAATLCILSQNITKQSVPIFKAKVRSLLTENDEKLFDELWTEIIAATMLSRSVSPIAFEPYVVKAQSEGRIAHLLRKFTKTTGKQLPSTDYAVVLPDGVVAIEVTVFNIGHLQKWQKRVNAIRDILSERILKSEGIYRDIDLALPLEFDASLGNKLCERRVTTKIMDKERGELTVDVGQETAHLRWRPMPIYDRSSLDIHNVPSEVNSFIVTEGGNLAKNGFGFRSRPTGDPKRFAELMLNSLRATLARKRDQFQGNTDRYVLIIKRGHHRMSSELLHDLFRSRIWPNSSYDWITCFGEFIPRHDYKKGTSHTSLTFQTNPNGKPLAGPFLTSLLSNEKTFHTDKGSITVSLHRGGQTSSPVKFSSPLAGVRGKLAIYYSTFRYVRNLLLKR
jgi:hypothetical protein